MRRSLVSELFFSGEIAERQYPRVISASYLATPAVRKGFLAALCAIVRHYQQRLEESKQAGYPVVLPPAMASFEEWSGFVSAVLQSAGYADPLIAPDLSAAGAVDDDEMKELLVKIATSEEQDETFDRRELVEAARQLGLLESLVGLKGDEDLDSSAMKKFGRQLQMHRGREYRDERGRLFRFSHRRQKRGATYPLTFVPQGAAPANQERQSGAE
jgi:hypothetical protein